MLEISVSDVQCSIDSNAAIFYLNEISSNRDHNPLHAKTGKYEVLLQKCL